MDKEEEREREREMDFICFFPAREEKERSSASFD